jgi:hypothetical protein
MRVENQTKTGVLEDSSLCPETSTKNAVQEFHLCTYTLYNGPYTTNVANLFGKCINVFRSAAQCLGCGRREGLNHTCAGCGFPLCSKAGREPVIFFLNIIVGFKAQKFPFFFIFIFI